MRKSTDVRGHVLARDLSRRDLLRWGALLGGGLMLHGCAPLKIGGEPTPTPAPPTPTPTPWPTPTPRAVGPATVALVRADSVADAVRRAVELAGGLDFIEPGHTVMVKPNVNSYHAYPATTHPEVVHAVVKLVLERDPARVFVADRCGPFGPGGRFGDTLEFMRTTGIYEAAVEAGAEATSFDKGPWIPVVRPAGAVNWRRGFSIPQQVVEVNHLISLPVAKTHRIATFTMSLKNWVGLLPSAKRLSSLHAQTTTEARLGSLIAELNLVAGPSLVVMDATKVFVSGGPEAGDAMEPGLIIASRDRVANDVTGLALLKTLGTTQWIEEHSVWEQSQIVRAVELGIGVGSAEEIELQSDNVPELEEIRSHLIA